MFVISSNWALLNSLFQISHWIPQKSARTRCFHFILLRPRICVCGNFLSFLPLTCLFLTEDIWIWSHSLWDCGGEIASPPLCETFVLADWVWAIDAGINTLLMPGCISLLSPRSLSQCILKYKSVNTQLSVLRSDHLLDTVDRPFSFSFCHHVCSTALPVVSQRALTQKVGLRTQRTVTWPTLWSGS